MLGLDFDSEGQVFIKAVMPMEFDSEGQLDLAKDETLILDSEQKLRVNIDDVTIKLLGDLVLDSEGNPVVDSEGHEERDDNLKLRVDIDNETIRINSEGQLSADALPKPLIPDAFLHVNSETAEAEWVEAKINGVSLVGDHNTEEAKIIWWGTSEEYQAIVDAGEVNDYTLYIINDGDEHEVQLDYDDLAHRPQLNGITLSGNKSLADFGIQPVLSGGTAISLNNNTIDLMYEPGVLTVDTSNRLTADTYTREAIDNMLASLRTIKYAATKPATPTRNTLYYVGSTSPYHMWLYDSYGTEIDLGTSDITFYTAGPGITINSSNVISADIVGTINEGETSVKAPTAAAVAAYAEHKTNKVTALSATSTNDQYPSAKLVYDQLLGKVGAIAPDDNSLQILEGTTLRHVEPTNLGPAGSIGSATSIPIINYDKFGHIQQVSSATVYPPTTAGLNGQLWVSDGDGAGGWSSLNNLVEVKYKSGTNAGVTDSTSFVLDAPAASTGFTRIACIGAYISCNVPNVKWAVTDINDAQVTIYANGWEGTKTITANSVWLYVRSAN